MSAQSHDSRPAGPGVDRHKRRIAVKFAAQKLLQFELRDVRLHSIKVPAYLRHRRRPDGGILLLRREFVHHRQILRAGLDVAERRDLRPERGDAFHLGLRLFLVVPKIRRGHARLDFLQLFNEVG